MKVIRYFFIAAVFMLYLISCKSSNTNPKLVEITDVTFSSEINPTKTDWKLGLTYKDTLEFISFDDNYDNWYALFKTKGGQTVSLIYDNVIKSEFSHDIFEVKWEIDSLYEAGDNGQMYFDERLLSYTVIEQPEFFGDFLVGFIKSYSNNDSINITNYINKELGFYTTKKSGLYCTIQKQDQPLIANFNDLNCKILGEKLLGNYCDGYPNIEDGLYFENILYDSIPTYESPVREHLKEYWFPLKLKHRVNQMKKVTIVMDEDQYSQLYFINYENKWYLWAEDLCNCNA
jgi:hypothetical protein